jgi:hypothetical protein
MRAAYPCCRRHAAPGQGARLRRSTRASPPSRLLATATVPSPPRTSEPPAPQAHRQTKRLPTRSSPHSSDVPNLLVYPIAHSSLPPRCRLSTPHLRYIFFIHYNVRPPPHISPQFRIRHSSSPAAPPLSCRDTNRVPTLRVWCGRVRSERRAEQQASPSPPAPDRILPSPNRWERGADPGNPPERAGRDEGCPRLLTPHALRPVLSYNPPCQHGRTPPGA